MSTYVTLVNQLLRRLNEVALDTAGDGFGTVKGVQALAKDAINNSIRTILQDGHEFPFLKTTYTETCVADTKTYAFPSDFSKVDWDTFYLKKLTSADNEPGHLRAMTFEEYTQKYRRMDDQDNSAATPFSVYQTYGESFGLYPKPDAAYEVEYVYWAYPADLTLYTDVCIIPSRWDHVIIDGAMMYMMRFRSNDNQAQIQEAALGEGIRTMRRLLIDEELQARSTMIVTSRSSGYLGVTNG
jgi:hypothetical protein